MRVLVVEPHEATAEAVRLMLSSEGWSVDLTADGDDAVEQGLMFDYDMILTEIELPGASGFDVIRRVRAAKNQTPIMVLSANAGVAERVKAFSLGADDVLMKPFHKDELIARVSAIVRRSKGHAQAVIEIDGLTVNLDARTASLDGSPLHLTGREYQIIELMAVRKGKVLTKEMFLDHLYGGRDEPELKIIDVWMCKLRRKMGERRDMIRCIWGRGYILTSRDDNRLAA